MMKAVLVIDMPETCGDCQLSVVVGDEPHPLSCNRRCSILNKYLPFSVLDIKQKDCPLREIPKESDRIEVDMFTCGYNDGWNDCLAEIIGE